MVIDFKKLIKNIAIPLIVGIVAGILTRDDVKAFTQTAVQPSFQPPPVLFPIVWTILYIMMGISAYIAETNQKNGDKSPFVFYYAQLFFNFVWSFIFFSAENYLLALVWIVILLMLIIITTIKFGQIKPAAAYLMIPYILWVSFATILNYSIYILNR